MKTIFKFFVAVCFMLSLGFIACNESDDSVNTNSSTESISERKSTFKEVSCNLDVNPENPYNYVGIIHNEIVLEYINKYEDNTVDLNTIISRVDELGRNNPNFREYMDENYTTINPEILMEGAHDFNNQFANTIQKMPISQKAKDELSKLVNYLFEVGYNEQETSLEEVSAFISELERSIIANDVFDKDDQRVLLSAVSTAMHSTCLWYNVYSQTSERATSNNNISLFAKRKWWQWAIIGVSDAVGAAVGAVPAAGTAGVAGATVVTAAVGASTLAYNMTNPSNK